MDESRAPPPSISSPASLSIPFSWHLRAELCPSPTSPRSSVSPNNVWFSHVSGEAGSVMRKTSHCASLSTPSPHNWPSLRAHPLTIWPNTKAPVPKCHFSVRGRALESSVSSLPAPTFLLKMSPCNSREQRVPNGCKIHAGTSGWASP